MYTLLWLVPALPFAGFFILALFGSKFSRAGAAYLGAGSVAGSAVITALLGAAFLSAPPVNYAYTQTLWQWLAVGGFNAAVALRLDALSLVMMLVVTWVGFLIHLYSVEFMKDDEGYARFFACMNLFVGAMLVLVLADNLLLLYLGWEGVGLCSYLLIGFWYKDPRNGYAARKAFVITRIGDTSLGIGLFLLYTNLGTLDIQELMVRAQQQWPVSSPLAVAAAALLLGGAVGKSAQLPLQTWLPDAMAGPTPVSALIHAATMVTAGVYLIARTHVLFSLAPQTQFCVAVIGAATLLTAGCSALVQRDIKRVLAYSTISQIGYMFLALGVGAWSAALFHFMTHAFFKSLLFLGAGAVILAVRDEHDMYKMGGLRTVLPVTFLTFLAGAASLSAFPLLTAGFYSKAGILNAAWYAPVGGPWLWLAGAAGSFLTSLYAFRMVFITFFGDARAEVGKRPGNLMKAPLVFLAGLSVFAGFLEIPGQGGPHLFSHFMSTSLPHRDILMESGGADLIRESIVVVLEVSGILLAYFIFIRTPHDKKERLFAKTSVPERFIFSGWGFDRLYDVLIVNPFLKISRMNRDDLMDLPFMGMAWAGRETNRILSSGQSGKVRQYAAWIAFGAVLLLAVMVLS